MKRTIAQYLKAIIAKLQAMVEKLEKTDPKAAGGPEGGTPPR